MDAHQIWKAVANGISLGCLIGLLAVGYSLVYGVAKLINFAHGDIFTLSGYYLFFLFGGTSSDSRNMLPFLIGTFAVAAFAGSRKFGRLHRVMIAAFGGVLGGAASLMLVGKLIPLFVLVPAGMIFIAIAGIAFEYLVYRPLEGSPRLSYLVAAIGLSLFLQGSMQLLFGTDRKAFPPTVVSQLYSIPVPHLLSGYFSGLDILMITFTVVVTVCLNYLAKKSIAGISIRATADNPDLAARLGLNVRRAKVQVFAIGSALAGACAFFFVARQRVLEPTLGYSQGILAFAAAVIGGIGRLSGALLGGLVIGMAISILPLIDTGWLERSVPKGWIQMLPSLNLSDWSLGIVYLLMVVILILKPHGLISERFSRNI